MEFKRLWRACASIIKRIKCVRFFVGLFVITLPVAAFPWSLFNSDASKYRDECYAKCIEDSFGKAGAREIEQRCSTKCRGLPKSPRREWSDYDHCVSIKTEHVELANLCHQNGGMVSGKSCVLHTSMAERYANWKPGEPTKKLIDSSCPKPDSLRPK